MPQLLRLWWSWTSSDECASTGPTARLTRTDRPWSEHATAGAFEAYSSEQRRGSSRAAWSVECARDTDKALGESQLSRPLMRAAATPSTGVCAPPHVPPPVHERSHENARLPHAPVPLQVMGALQRLFHESIPSTC